MEKIEVRRYDVIFEMLNRAEKSGLQAEVVVSFIDYILQDPSQDFTLAASQALYDWDL